MKDKDRGIFNILRNLKKIKLEVGVFADTQNSNSKPVSYVADYAIANEFGTKNIPERSFMRSTADTKESQWQDNLDKVADSVIAGEEVNIDRKLYETGQIVRRDIIEKIDSDIAPVNAASTRRKKIKQGKTKTLIDTGILRGSIEAKIKHV